MNLDSIDSLDFLSESGRKSLRVLAPALASGDVVLFAGAGLSFNACRNDGQPNRIPGWKALAARLREDLGDAIASDLDPLRIADYYQARYRRAALIDVVTRAIADHEHAPGRVHETLAELNLRDIITTNFDTLIERTFEMYRFRPQVIVRGSDFTAARRSPRIIKINGCIARDPARIVITGDDFLEYPSREPLLEAFATRSFVESRVLFVGFGLNDPTFRLINEKVLRLMGEQCPVSLALVFGVDPVESEYWRTRSVELIDLRPRDGDRELTHEERMYRVLHALVFSQRSGPSRSATAGRREEHRHARTAESDPVLPQAITGPADADLVITRAQSALELSDVALLDAGSRLTLDCLNTVSMPSRARYLDLALILAPLDDLAALLQSWTTDRDERRLLSTPAQRFEPTHDEYRLSILGFFGMLEDFPFALQRAADSLWFRQLSSVADMESPAPEAAARYRRILHFSAAKDHEWPGIWIHRRRLNRMGATLPDADSSMRDAMEALAHGWLFEASPALRFMTTAWSDARRKSKQGRLDDVRWPALLATTIAFHGEKLISELGDVLLEAWHGGVLDPLLLLRFVAHRIGKARFAIYERRTSDKSRVRPVVQAEEGLAALALWTISRVDQEQNSGALGEQALNEILPSIGPWLAATKSAVVRQALLQALVIMDGWNRQRAQSIILHWVDSHAHGELRTPLDIAALDRSGSLIADTDRTRFLLARARSSNLHGTDLRTDIEKWLIRWADSDLVPDTIIAEFARDLVQWMVEDEQTFEWIGRAARIRSSARLTAAVNLLEPIQEWGSIGRYVVNRLASLPADVAVLWPAKKSAFFGQLAAFAGDLDTEQRGMLMAMVEPSALTPDGRDGAAVLAVRMLDADPRSHGDAAPWTAHLETLVDLGATGWGALAGRLAHLSPAGQRKLESNLIVTMQRRLVTGNPEIVTWIGSIIAAAQEMPELEAALCTLLLERNRPFAMAAADTLRNLQSRRPDVIERNAESLRRALRVLQSAERAGMFRDSTRFVATVRELATGPRAQGPASASALPLHSS